MIVEILEIPVNSDSVGATGLLVDLKNVRKTLYKKLCYVN